MNYLAIALVLIIVAILYFTYNYMTNNSLTAGLQPLSNVISVDADEKLINPGSPTYSYQAWLYIQNPPTAKTVLFQRGTDFGVYLNGSTLTIESGGKTIMTVTDSFPMQKWTYLAINSINGKNVEAYLNGKLAKTIAVSTPMTVNAKTPLTIGSSGLSGYVSKMTRLPSSLDAATVYANYLSGNGLSSFLSIPYGMNLEITSGEDMSRVIKLW
jgi:hypothetical protein